MWLHVVRVWMGGWVGVGDAVVDTGADSAHTRTNTPLTKQTIPKVTAETSSASKHFSSVAYSADGSCVIAGAFCFGALYLYGCVPVSLLVSFPFLSTHTPPPPSPDHTTPHTPPPSNPPSGGRSKYVCIYHVASKQLLRKFQLSHDRTLDGVLDKLHSGAVYLNLCFGGLCVDRRGSWTNSLLECLPRHNDTQGAWAPTGSRWTGSTRTSRRTSRATTGASPCHPRPEPIMPSLIQSTQTPTIPPNPPTNKTNSGVGGDEALPGAKRAPDGSSRLATRPEVRSSCVRFSPTGREWAAATPQVCGWMVGVVFLVGAVVCVVHVVLTGFSRSQPH